LERANQLNPEDRLAAIISRTELVNPSFLIMAGTLGRPSREARPDGPLCNEPALKYTRRVKSLINKTFISIYVLDTVIEKVQDLVRISTGSGETIDPSFALRELQEGLTEASHLARELSSRNFAPEALKSQ
jgi:hypothetical protein